MTRVIGLDFETYCDLDLTKVGQDRYFAHPSFQVLCGGIYDPALPQETVEYDFVQWHTEATEQFVRHMDDVTSQGVVIAHNAGFERQCLRKLGFSPQVEINILDSAVHSRMMGGSSKLEYAARQFTNERKLETGLELIKLFSIPNERNKFQAPSAELLRSDPELMEKWKQFLLS